MTVSDPGGTPDPASTHLPLPQRVIQLFASPAALFRSLGEAPSTWGAVALGALVISLSSLLLPLAIWEETLRLQILETGQQLPIELATAARVGKVAAVLGPVLAWPITALVTAGLYSLLFLFILGYEGSYRQYLSVSAHALLVAALSTLVLLPFRILTEQAQFSLTLGSIFWWIDGGLAGRFLGLADLFQLWAFGLMGMGAAVLDGRRGVTASVSVALGAALLVWLGVAAILP